MAVMAVMKRRTTTRRELLQQVSMILIFVSGNLVMQNWGCEIQSFF